MDVYLTIDVENHESVKLRFKLFDDVVPKTAKNFRELCLHSKGFGYRGSVFHRLIPGFMMQGGDFTKHNGTGGKSIYGTKFEDENFDFSHSKMGLLSMANAGKNTNGSQFFVLFDKAPHLNKKHVVFGEIYPEDVSGLKALEAVGSDVGDKPLSRMVIVDCGIVDDQATAAAAVRGRKRRLDLSGERRRVVRPKKFRSAAADDSIKHSEAVQIALDEIDQLVALEEKRAVSADFDLKETEIRRKKARQALLEEWANAPLPEYMYLTVQRAQDARRKLAQKPKFSWEDRTFDAEFKKYRKRISKVRVSLKNASSKERRHYAINEARAAAEVSKRQKKGSGGISERNDKFLRRQQAFVSKDEGAKEMRAALRRGTA